MVKKSRLTVTVLIAALLAIVFIVPARSAYASTDDYPSNLKNATQDSVIDPWSYFNRECVSFVAWRLSSRNSMATADISGLGNATTWKDRAVARGFVADNNPAAGAVAWWDFGHVAWVESVSADSQTVHVEEYNYDFTGHYNNRDIAANTVTKFIHFRDALADGQVIENSTGGHHYVAAGGSLFWYDRNDAAQESLFVDQMHARLGASRQIKVMSDADIHAIEGTPTWTPRRKPNDGSFLKLRSSGSIYTMMYGRAFYVVSVAELGRLSGNGREVLVPDNAADGLTTTTPWDVVPSGRVLGKWATDHWDLYQTSGSTVRFFGSPAVQECLRVAQNTTLQVAPDSLFGAYTPVNAAVTCDFTAGRVIYGTGQASRWFVYGDNSSVAYTKLQYPSMFDVYCRGGMGVAQIEISAAAINAIPVNSQTWTCPDNSFVRNTSTGEVFQVLGGMLHYVPSAATWQCLVGGTPGQPTDIDAGTLSSVPRGTNAACNYEGKLLQSPGGQVYWIRDGQRRYVGNMAILYCLQGRAGTGAVIPVSQATADLYQEGNTAYCPYGPGVRFGKHASSPTVWRIFPNGTKQYASSLCSPQSDPRYYVWVFPDGEIDGHQLVGPNFVADAASCAAIP